MSGVAATISLGRDCTITVNGTPLAGVRSVDVAIKRKEVSFDAWDGNEYTLPGFRSATISIETISGADAATLASLIGTAAFIQVSGTNAGGTFIVTEVAASEPLDDVVSYVATLRSSKASFALE